MIGIYKVTNTINGGLYIGQSTHIERRFMEHRAPCNLSRNYAISKAFKEFGVHNFTFEVLELCEKELLCEREIYHIKTLSPMYNRNEGGNGKGRVVSQRERINASKNGKAQWERKTTEERINIISRLTGQPVGHAVSLVTREKLRNCNLGKRQSLETIAKRSASMSVSMLGNKSGNKKVAQVDSSTGIILEIFESARIAADKFNISPSGITHTLKGQQLTCAGFKWEYAS